MSKLLAWFLGITGVVAIAAMAVFNVPALQDTLFDRLSLLMMKLGPDGF